VEDARGPALAETKPFRDTWLEWLETVDGRAAFQLERFGDDDVAGTCAHVVGRAFVAWLPPTDPYRATAPTAAVTERPC